MQRFNDNHWVVLAITWQLHIQWFMYSWQHAGSAAKTQQLGLNDFAAYSTAQFMTKRECFIASVKFSYIRCH